MVRRHEMTCKGPEERGGSVEQVSRPAATTVGPAAIVVLAVPIAGSVESTAESAVRVAALAGRSGEHSERAAESAERLAARSDCSMAPAVPRGYRTMFAERSVA